MTGDPQFDIQVTEEMIRHSRIRDILYFVGFLYGAGVLLLVLMSGISARLRDVAEKMTKRRWVVSVIYVALFMIVTAVLQSPLAFYSGYVVPHQFDLSNQNFMQWLGDEGKELAVAIVLSCVAGALALFAIQTFKRWWLMIWLGSLPLTIFLVVLAPVFIDPLFNRFDPLEDQVLKQRLLDEAARAGIEGGRVYQVDRSKQTKTLNAYVTGIGPTKRIVMWDTLLAKMTRDEVVAVMGHEMGHYVLHHVWKGVAFSMAVSFVVMLVASWAYPAGVGRWGVRGVGDPAALPWLLFIVAVVFFLLAPVINGFSRRIEHQADVFGLELTHLNEASATAFIKLAEQSKTNPRPHPFIEWWRYSHPSIARRIEFVLKYKPWEKPLDAPRSVSDALDQ